MLPLNVLAASVRVTSEVVFAKHSGSDPGPSLTQSVKTVNPQAGSSARTGKALQPVCSRIAVLGGLRMRAHWYRLSQVRHGSA